MEILNILENMLFGTDKKNNNENEILRHDKALINENNALKIKIHLLNDELENVKYHNESLRTTNKKLKTAVNKK